jgi:glycogen operon protein
MQDNQWEESWIRSLGLYLNGSAPEIRDDHGVHHPDDDFIIAFNAHSEEIPFNLPAGLGGQWKVVFDTSLDNPMPEDAGKIVEFPYTLAPSSLTLLRHAR